MKKILVITPIYPSIGDPTRGSFILEQMRLVNDLFEFKVFVCLKNEINKTSFCNAILRPHSLYKLLSNENVSKNYDQSCETTAIHYPYVNFYLPWTMQYRRILRAFDRRLSLLISRGWKPDLIHAHYVEDAGIIANYLSHKYRIPYVLTEHNPPLLACGEKGKWKRLREAVQHASPLLLVSHDQMRRLMTNMYRKCSPIVIGNFVDEQVFMPKGYSGKKEFTALYVGYPHPLKDMETLFDTVGIMKAKGITGIKVLVVSPLDATPYFPQGLEALMRNRGLEDYLVLVGKVKRDQMSELINSCDLMLSSSINETFGLSLVEALMCGKPVVCTNSGGPQDFVTFRNGIIVNIMDPHAMADAILAVRNREIQFDPSAIRAEALMRFGKKAFRDRLLTSYASAQNTHCELEPRYTGDTHTNFSDEPDHTFYNL